MTQIDLLPSCRVPDKGGQNYEILMYLSRGGRLTVAKALSELGVYALSQRVGELKRDFGWPIQKRTVQVGPKTYVAEYFLEAA